ncbi:hypothetical protein Ciccas_004059 [Cichlidogyrus casuarinus]|uniref:Uncharacterized protein n=1 Tax=Cichlidogyrus casuarinus TaxID=1844966 RepID=A0ABD2QCK3_9PLAT
MSRLKSYATVYADLIILEVTNGYHKPSNESVERLQGYKQNGNRIPVAMSQQGQVMTTVDRCDVDVIEAPLPNT